MAGDKYAILNQKEYYFLTFTVIDWVDIFSRLEYRQIAVDSMNYCVQHKDWKIYAWVIMSNHIHIVCRAAGETGISAIIRDFKKFTSKRIIEAIKDIPESRRDWLLDKFSFEARRSRRAENYKLWRDSNHAICLGGNIDAIQKINYIHNNPVKAGIVEEPEHYLYSSARDYNERKGIVEVELL
jgi:REP element-mobilizing transposase RayT